MYDLFNNLTYNKTSELRPSYNGKLGLCMEAFWEVKMVEFREAGVKRCLTHLLYPHWHDDLISISHVYSHDLYYQYNKPRDLCRMKLNKFVLRRNALHVLIIKQELVVLWLIGGIGKENWNTRHAIFITYSPSSL